MSFVVTYAHYLQRLHRDAHLHHFWLHFISIILQRAGPSLPRRKSIHPSINANRSVCFHETSPLTLPRKNATYAIPAVVPFPIYISISKPTHTEHSAGYTAAVSAADSAATRGREVHRHYCCCCSHRRPFRPIHGSDQPTRHRSSWVGVCGVAGAGGGSTGYSSREWQGGIDRRRRSRCQ